MQNDNSLPGLTEALDQSNYHRWLGVFVVRSQAGDVELMLPYRDEFSSDDAIPIIHQGIIAAFAEITSALAARSVSGQTPPIQTLQLNYLRAAAIGNELYARGRVVGSRIYVDILTNDDRVVVARAIANVPALAPSSGVNSAAPRFEQPTYPV